MELLYKEENIASHAQNELHHNIVTRLSMLLLSPYASVLFSNMTYLTACFFSSSYMKRGERHPVASHGEILQEKLAPYMLF
jgi:hypothetical protein